MDNLLRYFFDEPEREFHVRELAKLMKKSPTTISKNLKDLEKQGLLISRQKYNHLFFKANNESKKFKEEKLFYNLNILRESGIVDFLNESYNNPPAIILFGSFRKGENTKQSDIDILIITPLKKSLDLSKYEKKLGHKIQVFLHSYVEINKMKKTNKELLNNFINGLVLEGFWEVLR